MRENEREEKCTGIDQIGLKVSGIIVLSLALALAHISEVDVKSVETTLNFESEGEGKLSILVDSDRIKDESFVVVRTGIEVILMDDRIVRN